VARCLYWCLSVQKWARIFEKWHGFLWDKLSKNQFIKATTSQFYGLLQYKNFYDFLSHFKLSCNALSKTLKLWIELNLPRISSMAVTPHSNGIYQKTGLCTLWGPQNWWKTTGKGERRDFSRTKLDELNLVNSVIIPMLNWW